MNKQIQGLMGKTLDKHFSHTWSTMNYDDVTKFAEKFAELIVRECVKVMYDNAMERKVPPDINQTPTHYAIAVLEHFGVEE